MTHKSNDFPRDLRSLVGGRVSDPDGSERELFNQVQSYANLWEARMEIKLLIEDPDAEFEEEIDPVAELEVVERRLDELKNRILRHYEPVPGGPGAQTAAGSNRVDHGAKSKAGKLIQDIEAGKYDPLKKSKTLQAVLSAFAYCRDNGRMPSHGELIALGYNNQQATDAGAWLDLHKDAELNRESLFLPLHKPKKGRPPKK